MSDMLRVGKDAIYAEYKKALQSARMKKPEIREENDKEVFEKPEPFTSIEILAGYIFHY